MRILGCLLTTSLFGVIGALSSSSSSPSHASVFYFPSPGSEERPNKPPSIPLAEAELVLAHRFGLSKFHALGEHDLERIVRLSKVDGLESKIFEGHSGDTRTEVVIAISGVKNVKDILPKGQPSFFIDHAVDATLMDQVFSTFSQEVSRLTGRSREALPLNPLNKDGLPGVFAVPQLDSVLSEGADFLPRSHGLDMTKPTQAQYVLEDLVLENLWYGDIHSEVTRKNTFIMLHLRSLEGLLKDSDASAYSLAVERLSKRLQNNDIFDSLTLILLPPSSSSSDSEISRSELRKRREALMSITNPSVTAPERTQSTHPTNKTDSGDLKAPKPDWNGCYKSEEDCSASTNTCSGHGKCTRSNYPYRDCWTCSCSPTEVKVGKSGYKKIYWAGSICQKQDISVQFHILVVFTIAMILAIGSALKLLFSVGNEELPGILTAGVTSKKG